MRRLFELSEAQYFDAGGEGPSEFCVVAVGGYARREMSIHSDVDLLCLYRDHVTPYVKAVAERLQTWLWDAQVTLGGAVRTRRRHDRARARRRHRVHVAARAALPGRQRDAVPPVHADGAGRAARPARGVHRRARSRRSQQRHTRYGESLYLLQPNVKEGAGGLRDYHAACWAMQAALPGARSRSDLLHQGLLTQQEMADMLARARLPLARAQRAAPATRAASTTR